MTRQGLRDNIVHQATVTGLLYLGHKSYDDPVKEFAPGWPNQPCRRAATDGYPEMDSQLFTLLQLWTPLLDTGLTHQELVELSVLWDEFFNGTISPDHPCHGQYLYALKTDWSEDIEKARKQLAGVRG